MKISVLKNFAKFTGKHLCQSLLFNKIKIVKLKTYNLVIAPVIFLKRSEV